MDNFSFKTWAEYKSETQPEEGFNVSSDYTSPQNETQVRNQLQSLHSQIKKFINETIVAGINSILSRLSSAEDDIDGLQENEITSIEGDSFISVVKSGKTYQVKIDAMPQGVTKAYVDNQDAAKLTEAKSYADARDENVLISAVASAKTYTDNKTRIIAGTLIAGNSTITFTDERITTQNLIISVFSPSIDIYEIADPVLDIVNHTITLSFETQQSDIIVAYKIEGEYQ